MDPSAWRVPVTVTVWLSDRSEVEPATVFDTAVVGLNVTVTSQPVLLRVMDDELRLLIVPRAKVCEPGAGVAPGLGHAPASAPPRPCANPPFPRVFDEVAALALTLFWPTL
jgi:hypothetical protein